MQAEHGTLIPLYLTGSAQLLYQSLPATVCGGNFHPLLHNNCCEAVRRLARRAYPTLAANVQDALAKEQLLAGIASCPVQLDARRSAPNSLNKALMQALQAQAIFATEDRQLENSSPVICGVTDKASDDTAAALQLILGRPVNLQARLDRQQSSHQEWDSSLLCHGCGGKGHFVASCPHNSCQIPKFPPRSSHNPVPTFCTIKLLWGSPSTHKLCLWCQVCDHTSRLRHSRIQ